MDGVAASATVVSFRRLWSTWNRIEGETPLEPERVSEKLHTRTFWAGRGGGVTHAISGFDMALWDILGKVTGQPAGRLLGGCYRRSVRPYASSLT